MSNQDFENIRPFFDSEVGEIVKDLAVSLDWVKIMSPIIGHDNALEIAESMPHVESIEEFQDELTSPFLEALIEGTTTGVTVSFENNDLEEYFSKAQLHLTNHKDIVLDPSLVNVARMGNGFSSTQVGIGDNLLTQKWVENLVRLNKCFVVPRSGSVREKLNSSLLVASYIRHVIKNEGSVWLAQREGRAKDGKDATSPALIRMLISEGGKDSWDSLRICPISISYEWDPCDSMKVRELLITERDEEYTKGEGEDEISMVLGLTEFKGRVHLHFCEPVEWEEEEGVRTERVLAAKVDNAIFNGYKIFPNQILSARKLGIEIPSIIDISLTDESEFEKRLENIISFVGDDFTRDQIVKKWCEITAQPLLAKLAIEI